MKTTIKKAITLAGLALLMIVSAVGQTKTRVTVPFDFQIGETRLAAGEYSIRSLSDNSPRQLHFVDSKGKPLAAVNAIPIQSTQLNEEGRLVFTKYGDRYFLSQVWDSRTGSGYELPKLEEERELMLGHTMQPRILAVQQGK